MQPQWPLLSRRAVLRAGQVAIALPLLPSLLPRGAQAAPPGGLRRFVALLHCDGVEPSKFFPSATGKGFALTEPLKSLQEAGIVDEVDLLSGLVHPTQQHGACSASFLLGAEQWKEEVRKSASLDVAIHDKLGGNTLLKSQLTLSTAHHKGSQLKASQIAGGFVSADGEAAIASNGYVDQGLPFSGSISQGTVRTPEYNPRKVFNALFCGGASNNCPGGQVIGGGGGTGGGSADTAKTKHRTSVLHAVAKQAKALKAKLGKYDQERMDEYLSGVADIEKRLPSSMPAPPPGGGGTVKAPTKEAFAGIPDSQNAWASLMSELMLKAFEANLVAVATLMLGHSDGGDLPSDLSPYQWKGAGGSFVSHYASHNTGAPGAPHATVVQAKVAVFSKLVQRLKSTADGAGGNLLDGTLVYYVSDFGDGNAHSAENPPVLLAGRSSGLVTGHNHRTFAKASSQGVLVSIAKQFGVSMPHLAQVQGLL